MNFIQGENGSGKTTVRETLLQTLFGPAPELGPPVGQRHKHAPCQAALTFKTENSEVYRVVRDFIKDLGILFRYDHSRRKFVPVEKRREEIYRLMQQQCGGIEAHQAAAYFCLDRSGLPSLSKHQRAHSSNALSLTASPAGGRLPETQHPPSLPELQRRLNDLKKKAEMAEEVYQLEEDLSEAQGRGRVLRKKLSEIEGIERELRGISEKTQVFDELDEAFEQIEQKIEVFECGRAERDRELSALEQESTLLEQQLGLVPSDPIYKNNSFLSGMVFTTLSIAIGLLVPLSGAYQHFYLASLLIGLGLMAGSVTADIRRHSRRRRLEERLHNRLRNMELLEARFRRENTELYAILKKTGTQSVETLKEKVSAYRLLSTTRQRLLEERERISEGRESQALRQDFEENQRVIGQLQEKMRDFEDIPLDLPSLREEIRTLEKQAGKGAAASPTGQNGQNGQWDPIRSLIESSLTRRPEALIEAAKKCFMKLSEGDEHDLLIDRSPSSHSLVSLVPKNTAQSVELEDLGDGTMDRVFLSFYWGFLLSLDRDYPFPALLDDPLLTQDTRRQERCLDILREISRKRQVILLSHRPFSRREGERLIQL